MRTFITTTGRKRRAGLQDMTFDGSATLHLAENREYIVPILCKALQIMEVLRAESSGLRLEDIHLATGIPKSTAYRIVRTLVAKHYVAQEQRNLYKWSAFTR